MISLILQEACQGVSYLLVPVSHVKPVRLRTLGLLTSGRLAHWYLAELGLEPSIYGFFLFFLSLFLTYKSHAGSRESGKLYSRVESVRLTCWVTW